LGGVGGWCFQEKRKQHSENVHGTPEECMKTAPSFHKRGEKNLASGKNFYNVKMEGVTQALQEKKEEMFLQKEGKKTGVGNPVGGEKGGQAKLPGKESLTGGEKRKLQKKKKGRLSFRGAQIRTPLLLFKKKGGGDRK